jgi:mitogen-activated protein kinase kinase kinase 9
MFSCGFGENYALGHNDKETLTVFKEISTLPTLMPSDIIDRIEAGLSHSACLINGICYL